MNDYLINIYLECYFNEFLKISANNIQETAKKSINEANIFQIEAIYQLPKYFFGTNTNHHHNDYT